MLSIWKAYFNFTYHIIAYTILTSTKLWSCPYNFRKYRTYCDLVKFGETYELTSTLHVPLLRKIYIQYCEKRRYFENAWVKLRQSFYNYTLTSTLHVPWLRKIYTILRKTAIFRECMSEIAPKFLQLHTNVNITCPLFTQNMYNIAKNGDISRTHE